MTLPRKRPIGIVILAVIWALISIYNIYQGLSVVVADLGYLPDLSDPRVPEWFRFGLPAEIVISFFALAFGFLTLLVVYGLWTAAPWSYTIALALPIVITVINLALMLLYLSAPRELGLTEAGTAVAPTIVGNIFAILLVWGYLTRPHVKQYLNRIPSPIPTSTPVPVPSAQPSLPIPLPTEPVAKAEEKRFCRYCGAELKSDAVFCEKCGRKMR